MGEVREWWSNVYQPERGYEGLGSKCSSHREARIANGELGGIPNCGKYRIHVRLKPEGAPKRYATITEQDAWEIDPVGSRYYAEQGNSLRYSARSGFYVADYSLLTRNEERT